MYLFFSEKMLNSTYLTNSLVNTDSFYSNFSDNTFQKVPITHLTCPMKQKISSLCKFLSVFINWFHLTCLTRFLVNTTFPIKNQKSLQPRSWCTGKSWFFYFLSFEIDLKKHQDLLPLLEIRDCQIFHNSTNILHIP